MLKQHSPVEQEERKNGTVWDWAGLVCLSSLLINTQETFVFSAPRAHACRESCTLSIPLFGILPSWLLGLTPFRHSGLNSNVCLLGAFSHSHSNPNDHHPGASSGAAQPSPVSSPGSLMWGLLNPESWQCGPAVNDSASCGWAHEHQSLRTTAMPPSLKSFSTAPITQKLVLFICSFLVSLLWQRIIMRMETLWPQLLL